MHEHKALAIQALQNMRGDDTMRAKAAARTCPVDVEYGRSGKTLTQIIAEYEAHDATVDAAIAWLRGV